MLPRPAMLRVSTLALTVALAAAPAYADIYTWVDANGVTNVSNLAPPANSRIDNVTVERTPPSSSRADAAREAARQAELQALSDRVRQLESEAQAVQAAPAAAPVQPIVVAPVYVPMPVVAPMVAPMAAPYVPTPPLQASACDPTWFGCTTLYSPNLIVVSSIAPRRSPYTTKPPGGPVHWPHGNVAALGPWAPGVSAHLPAQRPRP